MRYEEYLMHFNKNHDPNSGRFTSGSGGSLKKIVRGIKRQSDEERAEGAREDSRAYKYNKPGESGWKGLGRAVKANVTSQRGKAVLTVAGAAAAGVAIVGAARLAKQRKALEWLSDGNFTIPMSSRVAYVAKQAGKRALQAGLATYGAIKINDYVKKHPKSESTIRDMPNRIQRAQEKRLEQQMANQIFR